MKNLKLFTTVFAIGLMLFSCQEEETVPNNPKFEATSDQSNSNVGRTYVLADCNLFRSVVTPATFKPESTPFDNLYAGNFKDGVGLISDAKPGDQDYNGGRWHMFTLKAGVDPDKYTDACSEEDLNLDDFVSTGNYFECPLLPTKNN